jgi:hypothetical protein
MNQTTDPELSDEDLGVIAGKAASNFKGNAHQLEAAIGALFVAKHYGWKVVYLVHDIRTVRKYEKILGVNLKDTMPETGHRAERSLAYVAAQKVSSFWKAVKGEIPGIKTPDIK